ncbi:MAG: STAS domain-containing protein [Nitrospira sp.]|nr:STAS domain-containing protein [Nitrospira sp.]MCB9711916.1 STAS domain-containing protein [Nitrospiraceae bacterium]MDR4487589.1 STAS domain-containing protein [Nitrospirales bacterium]MCA9465949.1 STAS domain-containing protein [Nitrospira sp.]MCA9475388.1 STAS domain-containing protein [Nitrospira sp.]
MLIMAKWSQSTRVLFLSGRFDKSARVPMETALAAGEGRFCQKLILDFSKVSSMDSAGIGKLLLLYYSLRKKGVGLVIHNPRPTVEELLQLVNLSSQIPITHDQVGVRSVA